MCFHGPVFLPSPTSASCPCCGPNRNAGALSRASFFTLCGRRLPACPANWESRMSGFAALRTKAKSSAASIVFAGLVCAAGKYPLTPRERCWGGGGPGYDSYARARPIFFVQTPQRITSIAEHDQQIRHIYMNVPHSANLKPSWYGESVGHYEADTLVVDTIGLNDQTFVDNFRTPHTDKLHVVERIRLIDRGKAMQGNITFDNPQAFSGSCARV